MDGSYLSGSTPVSKKWKSKVLFNLCQSNKSEYFLIEIEQIVPYTIPIPIVLLLSTYIFSLPAANKSKPNTLKSIVANLLK